MSAKTDHDTKAPDGTAIKRGSVLVGHVTQAQPHSSAKGSADSTLGIVFDKAITNDGHQVPLNSTIAALSAAHGEAGLAGNDTDIGAMAAGSAASRGSGLVGGLGGSATGAVGGLTHGISGTVSAAASGTAGLASRSAGALGGMNAMGEISSGSRGVFGLDGIRLASAGEAGGQASVLRSSSHTIRLESGTKMLLSNPTATGSAAANVTANH